MLTTAEIVRNKAAEILLSVIKVFLRDTFCDVLQNVFILEAFSQRNTKTLFVDDRLVTKASRYTIFALAWL